MELLTRLRGEQHERRLAVSRASSAEDRTVTLSFASTEPYRRWWGVEVLDVSPGAMDLKRLQRGAPLLLQHNPDQHIGIVEQVWIADQRAYARVRFGRSTLAEEVYRDVIDGVRHAVSVGYEIQDMQLAERGADGEPDTFRVTSWLPLEVSIVSLAADPTVGVGRALHTKANMETKATPQDAREVQRRADLLEHGRAFAAFGGVETALDLINDPTATTETLKQRIFAKLGANPQKPTATAEPFYGPTSYGDGARHVLPQSRVFKGPEAQRDAYAFGQFVRGLYGNENAERWCRDNGIALRSMSSAVAAQGGILVPAPLSSQIIDLMDAYGVARQFSDVWPMSSDQLTIPRSLTDPSTSFVGESQQISESSGTWDSVTLSVKKLGTLVRVPTELLDDAVIDVGDRIAFQMARAFSKKEDQCLFLGDGTSTYGGMQGLANALGAGSKVTAATGHDTFAEIDANDLASLIAKVPEFALSGSAFYCSATAWSLLFMRLMQAAGGNSVATLTGEVTPSYAGFPVRLSPILPSSTASLTGAPMLYFGNLQMATKFGSRRELRMQTLVERYSEFDEVGFQATERFDSIVTEGKSATVAGPLVALVGA